MATKQHVDVAVPAELLDAIRAFPLEREVEHCGIRLTVAPFDFYADCPRCATRIKVRSFSGVAEIEELFDAVFEWMNQPCADEVAMRRRAVLRDDD